VLIGTLFLAIFIKENYVAIPMENYNLFADFLNKYSQLTPWVQAILGVMGFGSIACISYFFKETMVVLISQFNKGRNNPAIIEPKKEWRDKYYRDEKLQS